MGDMGSLLSVLKQTGYKWIRVSYRSVFHKIGVMKSEPTGTIIKRDDMLILENHYVGFDSFVVNHIQTTSRETYTISAHPLMLDFPEKTENKLNLEAFLNTLTKEEAVDFIRPSDLLR
jgi:hypothetical protein